MRTAIGALVIGILLPAAAAAQVPAATELPPATPLPSATSLSSATPLLLAASPLALPAPVPLEPRTRLEALLVQDSVVVVRGSSRVGAVRAEPGLLVALSAKEFTNAISGERAHGIALELRKLDHSEPDATAFVDFDEIAPLLGGLEYLSRVDRSSTSLDQFEASYRTKGGLVVSVYSTSGGMRAAVACHGLLTVTGAEMDFAEFLRVRQLVQNAYDTLKAIRGEK